MAMDIRKIRTLIEMVENTRVAELEIREGEDVVRIVSQHLASPQVNYAPAALPTTAPPPAHNATSPVSTTAPQPVATETAPSHGHQIKSPMVGTAYLAATPDADDFVKIGQKVSVGDVLCIVEAMKMFNHIESDTAGVITARLIDNGQPVEYDQPLFVIEKS
jgi:acetyl-CoA carboxylase biotin carboxyl carrier protein